MNTEVLRAFTVVVRTGNITHAAQELEISQPTLSRRIKELETELGTALFDRSTRHLTLTTAGKRFEHYARTVVVQLDQALIDLSMTASSVVGNLTIGCVESSISQNLAQWVTQFQKLHEHITITLFSSDSDTIKQKLDNNELDLAFLIEPVEVTKYSSRRMNIRDRWGILCTASVAKDYPQGITSAQFEKLAHAHPLIYDSTRYCTQPVIKNFADRSPKT